MAERFFTPMPLANTQVLLEGPEAHHLLHVIRAKAGTEVVLFDGSGLEAAARVDGVSRSSVNLTVLSRRQVDRERKVHITLAVSLPKGDRQRWLVEKAVELGIRRLVPLETSRGVAEATTAALARMRRTVVEACKQCGRNVLMEIMPPIEWTAYAAAATAPVCWLAHPGGEPLVAIVRRLAAGEPPLAFDLAIGPEGGFTPEEVTAGAAAGWRPVDLGPSILRIESAAVYLAAAACMAGDQGRWP
jgi:16S rRNA (uracil1498-N3)-methyltransferase